MKSGRASDEPMREVIRDGSSPPSERAPGPRYTLAKAAIRRPAKKKQPYTTLNTWE